MGENFSMYHLLIRSLISQISIVEKIDFQQNRGSKKIPLAIVELEKYAKKTHQPMLFLVPSYIYYFLIVFRNKNFNHFYLQLKSFFEQIESLKLPKFTNEDCYILQEVHESWNNMNKLKPSTLPFRFRKLLGESKIDIGKNTFFKHSSNYVHFIQIAHYINNNRKYFPKIHSYEEFFIHLPIILKKTGEFQTYSYLNPMYLDKFYFKVYDDVSRPMRLKTFLQGIVPSEELLEEYQKSKIFGAVYAEEYIKEKILNGN
jgi:hypothetical protein